MSTMQERETIDYYTFVHMLFGFVARKLGLSIDTIMGIALVYEMLEPSLLVWLKKNFDAFGWGYESHLNIVMDILSAYIGAKIGEKI